MQVNDFNGNCLIISCRIQVSSFPLSVIAFVIWFQPTSSDYCSWLSFCICFRSSVRIEPRI